jgi:glycosyltransferase involved in cell wall biosynthesis
MRICLIAEGSYPYITGGVSSWVQMLLTNLSEYEFIICTIGAHQVYRGRYSYPIPKNVVEVKEILIDEAVAPKVRWGRRTGLQPTERKVLTRHLLGDDIDWVSLFACFRRCGARTAQEFVASRDFFDVVIDAYEMQYSHLPFVDFYWNLRSMVSPLYHVVRSRVPEAELYHSVSAGYAGVLGSLGKSLRQKPFVVTEHGIYTREREEEIIKSEWIKGCFKDLWMQHFYSLSRCAYTHADRVITLFDRNRGIQIELGCQPDKIDIIPNGVRAERFLNLPTKDDADDYTNVGAVVRVVPIKDIKTMLEAFAMTKREFPRVRFFIMGPLDEDEDYVRDCQMLAEELSLSEVTFTGKVDIGEYIGKMDILVLTSISEGQPLAVLEGMASGKPFVATDVGSCQELLCGNGDGYGDAGITLPVMDAERLSKAIVMLCNHKEMREQMGRNGRARVMDLYSEERMIASYRSLYAKLGSQGYGRNRV